MYSLSRQPTPASAYAVVVACTTALLLCGARAAPPPDAWRGHPASTLANAVVRGAPGWLLDGKPYVPILAQAGTAGICEVRDGRLWLHRALRVETRVPAELGASFSVVCVLSLESADCDDGGVYFELNGRSAAGHPKRYPIKLGLYGKEVCGVMNWPGPDGTYAVRTPVGKPLGEAVRLRLAVAGARLNLEADGVSLGAWTDPDPLAAVETVAVGAYASRGAADELLLEAADGKVLLREMFDDAAATYGRCRGDLPTTGLLRSSFFSAGIPVYTTWEWGPEMSTVWREDGSFDWWEVDGYLRKVAAMDPGGRLHVRFNFGRAPAWWQARHPDQIVHVRHGEDTPQPYEDVASFASKPYWAMCEEAARDLGRYALKHPEGWRLVGVTYSGGECEFVPHWTGKTYSDYSPAFLAGFREWLTGRYGTEERLRAAWHDPKASLDTAEVPSPEQRLKGDWHDFYDPTKGMQRIDFAAYYAEVTAGLITRLARALKEGSDGRFYTRPMTGYQPGSQAFRFAAGPHADFATMLESPWIDGFFMPHDYRGRGHGGFTAFEIPLASILLHGKTYITEMDDRTHLSQGGGQSRTETPWQTEQVAVRNVATALCSAAGAEFKDWARGWWEDEPTMAVVRRLHRLAQESVRHERLPTARIAVILNPRSTLYLRDESMLYQTLNNQQMHLTYPRIGAPHDRLLIDDLPQARDYDLYIVQDCLYLTTAERRVLKELLCRRGKTVLWLYAPGIVGEEGICLEAVSDLVGMRLQVEGVTAKLHLKLSHGTHPYNQGVAGSEVPTYDELGPLFSVADPDATVLGMGWNHYGVNRPCFAVKEMPDWTSVYCSVPALPPTVIRNIARVAGVHIYADHDDFVAANGWLLCVCAASTGKRTIRLPRRATVVDALTGKVTARRVTQFEVDLAYGETRVWELR